jgi:putative transposase
MFIAAWMLSVLAVRSKMNTNDVLDVLFDLILKLGKPKFIRSENGAGFIAKHLQTWLRKVGIEPIQIYPSSPWENGYSERFNGTLRNEVLNAEWFYTVQQAQTAINVWLNQYNHIRPHHGLNMRAPVTEKLIEKSINTGIENWG